MSEVSSKRNVILVLLLALSLVMSGAALTMEIIEKCNELYVQDQYTLYIGTNDKDTNLPEIPFDECQKRVEKVCLEYVTGFTLTEGHGVWTNEAGDIVKERTLICCIDGADADEINAVVNRLLMELNQSSIMVEHQKLNYSYQSR